MIDMLYLIYIMISASSFRINRFEYDEDDDEDDDDDNDGNDDDDDSDEENDDNNHHHYNIIFDIMTTGTVVGLSERFTGIGVIIDTFRNVETITKVTYYL